MTADAQRQPQAQKRLSGRVALITGASRGIGAAVAARFAAEGAHVVLLARTQGALEELDDKIQAAGGTATLLPFDLGETRKIPAIGPALAEKFKRLDILVGNGAILGPLSPVAMSDAKAYDEVMKINFTANVQLIRALDPLLRGSDAGRAIFVTSRAAQTPRPFWGAYAASKAALEAAVSAYAQEVAHTPVKVNLIDPGRVRTAMRREAMPSEDPNTLRQPEQITDAFVDLADPVCALNGQRIHAQNS
jgi:NAD(P)-dependent dehydrogenase (short-subunit alcohol dehydrogenase family)